MLSDRTALETAENALIGLAHKMIFSEKRADHAPHFLESFYTQTNIAPNDKLNLLMQMHTFDFAIPKAHRVRTSLGIILPFYLTTDAQHRYLDFLTDLSKTQDIKPLLACGLSYSCGQCKALTLSSEFTYSLATAESYVNLLQTLSLTTKEFEELCPYNTPIYAYLLVKKEILVDDEILKLLDKKAIFEVIKNLPHETGTPELFSMLDESTPVGHLMWLARGNKDTDVSRGTLQLVVSELKARNIDLKEKLTELKLLKAATKNQSNGLMHKLFHHDKKTDTQDSAIGHQKKL